VKKILKITLIVLLVVIFLFVFLGGLFFYSIYQEVKWVENAHNRLYAPFGEEMFNKDLKECNLAYSSYSVPPLLSTPPQWEIHGIEDDLCIVHYYGDFEVEVKYDGSTEWFDWRSTAYTCKLPQKIYSNPDNIDWQSLLEGEPCKIVS